MSKWLPDDPKMTARWSQNDYRMVPKWLQDDPNMIARWSQNDCQTVPKWLPDDPTSTLNRPQIDPRSTPNRLIKTNCKYINNISLAFIVCMVGYLHESGRAHVYIKQNIIHWQKKCFRASPSQVVPSTRWLAQGGSWGCQHTSPTHWKAVHMKHLQS